MNSVVFLPQGILTMDQLVRKTGLSRNRLYERIKAGDIKGVKIRHHWYLEDPKGKVRKHKYPLSRKSTGLMTLAQRRARSRYIDSLIRASLK